jgi:hypothetical protein
MRHPKYGACASHEALHEAMKKLASPLAHNAAIEFTKKHEYVCDMCRWFSYKTRYEELMGRAWIAIGLRERWQGHMEKKHG